MIATTFVIKCVIDMYNETMESLEPFGPYYKVISILFIVANTVRFTVR